MKITTGMVVPISITFHMKSDGGWRGIRTGVLASRILSPVIGSKGLASDNTVRKGAMSEVGVVLERHADGDEDDEDSRWTTNFFYLPRSRTIPEVV